MALTKAEHEIEKLNDSAWQAVANAAKALRVLQEAVDASQGESSFEDLSYLGKKLNKEIKEYSYIWDEYCDHELYTADANKNGEPIIIERCRNCDHSRQLSPRSSVSQGF